MVTWQTKAIAGFLGALCISLVKLGRASFFLDAGSHAAMGAYLTYCGYLIVGAAVGVYFAEHFEEANKTRKSAFLFGVLAPSVLLTIVSTPQLAREGPAVEPPTVPQLSMLLAPFVSPAIAAGASGALATSAPLPSANSPSMLPSTSDVSGAPRAESVVTTGPTVILTKEYAAPTFADGVKAALGIAAPVPRVLDVIGQTRNQNDASKTANLLNGFLEKSSTLEDTQAKVVKPYNADTYYVTVGVPLAPAKADELRQRIKTSAANVLTGTPDHDDKNAAAMLIKGQSVPSTYLFPQ
ncbi:hypothetical protein [Paraburkholderia aromaticivorans]|uniref:hypothetical protein n=1 Tax=Paraburkholderia aromaticivorans TaxID=2026199 RepID=UPI0038BDE6D8